MPGLSIEEGQLVGTYWDSRGRRFGRRAFVGGATAGTAAFALVGCGDDDNEPHPTASTGGGTTAAGGSATAAATKEISKMTEEEFFASLPESPPKNWTDQDIKMGGRPVRMV